MALRAPSPARCLRRPAAPSSVVTRLLGALHGVRAPKATRVGTADPEAYAWYLRGQVLFGRRTAQTVRQSIALFERAVARDPRFARAQESHWIQRWRKRGGDWVCDVESVGESRGRRELSAGADARLQCRDALGLARAESLDVGRSEVARDRTARAQAAEPA